MEYIYSKDTDLTEKISKTTRYKDLNGNDIAPNTVVEITKPNRKVEVSLVYNGATFIKRKG